jgi:diguanylate cyclase (GGDEF)-like protein
MVALNKKTLNNTAPEETGSHSFAFSNITTGIYAICAAVIVVFIISVFQVLNNAGMIADDVRAEVEHNLVRNEISRQIEILALDQSQISYWDEAVIALAQPVDRKFVQKEIADWLWDDFAIENSIVVSANGSPVVMVSKDRILTPGKAHTWISQNLDLVEIARNNYINNRIKRGNGFVVNGDPVRSQNPLYASDFRQINGQLGIVVAQAIVSDSEEILPTGLPQVLITFKPVSGKAFSAMGKKLNLSDFQIVPVEKVTKSYNSIIIAASPKNQNFKAVWRTDLPSTIIWKQSVVVVVGLFLMISFALGMTARRYSRALGTLQKSEKHNRFLALHDPLTKLPNRLQFDRLLDEIITEGKQDSCAVLCADLDRFKTVNDTYGHQAGDAVIKTVAERIAKAVGDQGMAARIGGDEFIILLIGKRDRDSVLFLCDHIIEKACEEVAFEGGVATVSMSIGVAWWPDDALTAKSIIRSADEALYRAKENGRGQTCSVNSFPKESADAVRTIAA